MELIEVMKSIEENSANLIEEKTEEHSGKNE